MKCKKTLVVALWAMFVSLSALAQKGNEQQLEKEANALFKSGEFLKAYPLYSQLLALYPADAVYNYKFGACAIYSDPDKTKAVKFLTIATSKALDDPMAWYYLGKAYHLNYQFKDAVKSYEAFLRLADPKIASKTDAQRAIETCIYGSNHLANIKDIDVLSKTDADKNNFFRYFNLEEVGGKILTVPDELKSSLDKKSKETGVMHFAGNSTVIFFSSYGKDGTTGKDIYKANVLPDGKYSTPEKVKGDVNTKYDEDFCFMHSDGKTLYFASKGHNSMGGYDIFKSTYDAAANTFGPVVNMDFAINTPDDDIFYITDSLNQRAYFASGRSSDLNHLSVYNVMVQTTPLQVVYLKGEFFSEINNDQKIASFKIIDPNSNRVICEANTNSKGDYVLYVPRSGDYTFKVTTENSPAVHELKVGIPAFDRPVALRQEMRLISENGKDKIIFKNHFEEPLEEDLTTLAADMLRKKAGLDANVSPDFANNNDNAPAANAHALEPTMQNAPLAAGFADGVTVQSIITNMEMELAEIQNFVAESDQKFDNSFAYALKKQREADAALLKAESVRKSVGGYTSNEDLIKLRESNAYTAQAEALQREAFSAMNAAEAVKQYKSKEATRAEAMDEQVRMLKQAESTQNFDAAVAALKKEKERNNAQNGGNNSTPFGELMAKAKSKESELQAAERMLTDLRAREKSMDASAKAAQEKIALATKKSERSAAENEYLNQKSDLDKVRKNIVSQNALIKKLGDETKLAFSNVEVYKRLAADTEMGLVSVEKKQLTEAEKTALTMKLSEMNNRISALEITDPQMLAMISDDSMGNSNTVITSSKGGMNITATKDVAAQSIKEDKEIALKRTGTDPSLAPTRRMYIAGSLEQTNAKIRTIEIKKQQGNYSEADEQELTALNQLRSELTTEMGANKTVATSISEAEYSSTVAMVIPNYANDMQAMSAGSNSQMQAAEERLTYNTAAINYMKAARVSNAKAAMSETSAARIQDFTKKDQQLEASIQRMEAESKSANVFAQAFDQDNKAIIESDELAEVKMQKQADIASDYISILKELEKDKQNDLALALDNDQANQIKTELAAINQEKANASDKLLVYQKSSNIAVAESTGTKANNNSIKPSAIKTLEDEMEIEDQKLTSTRTSVAQSVPKKTEAEVAKDAINVQKMFKPQVESESIFAYESGIFEEIAAKHQSEENKLKNREKISELNSSIFLVEGEMENVTSESKLRKLDYQAEQLYLKRALIEIDNSPAIARMASLEYESQSAKAKEMCQENREKIDSRFTLKEEVARLESQAKQNMVEAEELRKLSPSIQDDIERADNDRQAFAKEALAIEQLRRIQDLNTNIDMLMAYTDQNIAVLKTGEVPNDYKDKPLVAEVNTTETSEGVVNSDIAIDSSNAAATEDAASIELTLETEGASIASSDAPTSTQSGGVKTTYNEVKTTYAEAGTNNGSATLAANQTATPTKGATASNASYTPADATASSATAENKANNSSAAGSQSITNKVDIKAEVKSNASTASPKSTATLNNESLANNSKSSSASSANSALNTAMANSPSTASAESSAMASSYFYAAPKVLTTDIFSRTNKAVYTNSQPIPMDMEMPSGIYYKVQVGAFRNDIPQNLYDEFAPISGEKLNNGITRYTAGFFMNFKNADDIKREIRSIGYADAFVVAFRDGKRIPLYEAMGQTEGTDMMAAVEKEYVHGDKGEAPKSNIKATPKSTTPSGGSSKPKANNKNSNVANNGGIIHTVGNNNNGSSVVSDYYAGFPEAVKATKVEITQGLFFTVQVGVYSRPVVSKSLHYINPVNSELTESKKIRYTSGMYTTMQEAVDKRAEARALGIADAFVTAYYNGKRISLSEADILLKEKGNSILITKGIN